MDPRIATYLSIGNTIWLVALTAKLVNMSRDVNSKLLALGEKVNSLYEVSRAHHKHIDHIPRIVSSLKQLDREVGQLTENPDVDDFDRIVSDIDEIVKALAQADIKPNVSGGRSYGRPPKRSHRTRDGRVSNSRRSLYNDTSSDEDDFDPRDVVYTVRSRTR